MGSSRFWLKDADEESKSIPHEFPRSHWLKATGQCVTERYLSATMDQTVDADSMVGRTKVLYAVLFARSCHSSAVLLLWFSLLLVFVVRSGTLQFIYVHIDSRVNTF